MISSPGRNGSVDRLGVPSMKNYRSFENWHVRRDFASVLRRGVDTFWAYFGGGSGGEALGRPTWAGNGLLSYGRSGSTDGHDVVDVYLEILRKTESAQNTGEDDSPQRNYREQKTREHKMLRTRKRPWNLLPFEFQFQWPDSVDNYFAWCQRRFGSYTLHDSCWH